MKTIKELWNETPHGEAIKAPEYQYFVKWLDEKRIFTTVKNLVNMIPGLWDMNCEEAIQAVSDWLKRETIRNPNFLDELNEYEKKAF